MWLPEVRPLWWAEAWLKGLKAGPALVGEGLWVRLGGLWAAVPVAWLVVVV